MFCKRNSTTIKTSLEFIKAFALANLNQKTVSGFNAALKGYQLALESSNAKDPVEQIKLINNIGHCHSKLAPTDATHFKPAAECFLEVLCCPVTADSVKKKAYDRLQSLLDTEKKQCPAGKRDAHAVVEMFQLTEGASVTICVTDAKRVGDELRFLELQSYLASSLGGVQALLLEQGKDLNEMLREKLETLVPKVRLHRLQDLSLHEPIASEDPYVKPPSKPSTYDPRALAHYHCLVSAHSGNPKLPFGVLKAGGNLPLLFASDEKLNLASLTEFDELHAFVPKTRVVKLEDLFKDPGMLWADAKDKGKSFVVKGEGFMGESVIRVSSPEDVTSKMLTLFRRGGYINNLVVQDYIEGQEKRGRPQKGDPTVRSIFILSRAYNPDNKRVETTLIPVLHFHRFPDKNDEGIVKSKHQTQWPCCQKTWRTHITKRLCLRWVILNS